MGLIKQYKEYYIVYFKDETTVELSDRAYSAIKKQLNTPGSSFIEIDSQMYNKYEIRKIVKSTASSDVDDYILKQPKNIRDAIRKHAKEKNIIRNSIEHVSNFIKGNFQN